MILKCLHCNRKINNNNISINTTFLFCNKSCLINYATIQSFETKIEINNNIINNRIHNVPMYLTELTKRRLNNA